MRAKKETSDLSYIFKESFRRYIPFYSGTITSIKIKGI